MTDISDVLFICTGNIFRSLTAEYTLKHCQGLGVECQVRSAGLIEAPHEIVSFVSDYFISRSIDISRHRPQKLTREMLNEARLAVAMGTEHRQKVYEIYNRRLPLFSEIAYGTEEPLLDVFEVVPNWRNNETEASAYGRSVMDYISDGMPGFISRMHTFANLPGQTGDL